MRTRSKVSLARVQARRAVARWRALPDALIIGAQRGGTSSMYRYLGGHPDVTASLRKETEYFATEFHRGVSWYRAHFPLVGGSAHRRPLTFEATPSYLLHPLAAERAAALVPDARIVVMLRNPVDRAYSQYLHNRRLGVEDLSFDDAIAAEPERLRGEHDRIERNPLYEALPLRRFGYAERGKYAEQLERWLAAYDSVHVIDSEVFIADPRPVFASVLDFLGLTPWEPASFENYSYTRAKPTANDTMSPAMRTLLASRFEDSNRRLARLIDTDLTWL